MEDPTWEELARENAELRAQIAFLQQFCPASFNGDGMRQNFLELLKRSLKDRKLVAAARRTLDSILAGRPCDAAEHSTWWSSRAKDPAFIARCRGKNGYRRILVGFTACQTEQFDARWETLLDRAGRDANLLPELDGILAELGMFARAVEKNGCGQPE